MKNIVVANLVKSMLKELVSSLEGKNIITIQWKRQTISGL
jgi:hypothetical protein